MNQDSAAAVRLDALTSRLLLDHIKDICYDGNGMVGFTVCARPSSTIIFILRARLYDMDEPEME